MFKFFTEIWNFSTWQISTDIICDICDKYEVWSVPFLHVYYAVHHSVFQIVIVINYMFHVLKYQWIKSSGFDLKSDSLSIYLWMNVWPNENIWFPVIFSFIVAIVLRTSSWHKISQFNWTSKASDDLQLELDKNTRVRRQEGHVWSARKTGTKERNHDDFVNHSIWWSWQVV